MDLGLALRPTVFSPTESVKITSELSSVSYFFIPDIQGTTDPIVLALSILMKRDDCYAGSGVIRILEHDILNLSRQVRTIQDLTGNRFFLGVGVGATPNSASTIMDQFINSINSVRSTNNELKIYAAALREGMARKVAGIADGIILNFSTFSHAGRMARAFKSRGGRTVFSYLKIFISWNEERAEEMAKEELVKYGSMPQYASLFEKEKIIREVSNIEENSRNILKVLQAKGVLLVNPSNSELNTAIMFFKNSGVDVPIIYPYFSLNYSTEEKIESLKKLI
ncbi:MAG: hypothetical protein ACP5TZ_04980 [Nitrososphaeria archaeon]